MASVEHSPHLGPDWVTYTPALTGAGGNPTLGTGGVASGKYTRNGKKVHVEAYIKFGTAGVAAGTGDYSISLPLTGAAPLRTGGEMPVGRGWANPDGTLVAVSVELMDTTTVKLRSTGAGATFVGAAVPAAWVAGGEMAVVFDYEVAA